MSAGHQAAAGAMAGGAPGLINPSLPNTFQFGGTPVFQVGNNGVLTYDAGGATVNWVDPASAEIAAQWEVMAHLNGGGMGGGGSAMDTWLSCATTRSWNSGGADVQFSFRGAADHVVQSSQSVLFAS